MKNISLYVLLPAYIIGQAVFSYLQSYKIKKIMDNTQAALDELDAIAAKVQKIGTESTATLAKVTELENAANNNPNTPAEVLEKIRAVRAQVDKVDELVVDKEPILGTEAGEDTGNTGTTEGGGEVVDPAT